MRLCALTFLAAVKKEDEKWRRLIRLRMQMQTLQTRMQMQTRMQRNFSLHQRNRRYSRLARSAAMGGAASAHPPPRQFWTL